MSDVRPFLAWSNPGKRSPVVGVAFATHVETLLLPTLSRSEWGSHERPLANLVTPARAQEVTFSRRSYSLADSTIRVGHAAYS